MNYVRSIEERICLSHKIYQSGKHVNPNELKVAIIILLVFSLFSKVSKF